MKPAMTLMKYLHNQTSRLIRCCGRVGTRPYVARFRCGENAPAAKLGDA